MMKTKYKSAKIILLLIFFSISLTRSQTISTDAQSVSTCLGEVTVPIVVTNINNISAISLTLNYDSSILNWDSYLNEQEELSSGYLIVNSNGFQVIVSWFSLTPVNFGNDTLVELKFTTASPGNADLSWDLTVPDNCMFTDANYNTVTAVYNNGIAKVEDCSSIYGDVYYDNSSKTPMNNSSVTLQNILGDQLDIETTDPNGDFVFDTLLSGLYTFDFSTTKSWGGVNSTDALGIMRHFVLFDTLRGIRLAAADVDASGFVNTLDALATAQRFAWFISYFPAGDWLFLAETVSLLPGIDTTTHIQTLCYGDIDGSYLPPFVKTSNGVKWTSNNAISANISREFYVPLKVERDMEIGAISLVLSYPQQDLEVIDVKLENGESHNSLIYSTYQGKLRIAWFDLDPIELIAGEVFMELRCRLNNTGEGDISFSVVDYSEFADAEANVIHDVVIDIPKITPGSERQDDFSFSPVYPNPATNNINIEFYLPEDAEVSIGIFDGMGKLVTESNESLSAGHQQTVADVSQLRSGIYYLRIDVNSNQQSYSHSETIIIRKR